MAGRRTRPRSSEISGRHIDQAATAYRTAPLAMRVPRAKAGSIESDKAYFLITKSDAYMKHAGVPILKMMAVTRDALALPGHGC